MITNKYAGGLVVSLLRWGLTNTLRVPLCPATRLPHSQRPKNFCNSNTTYAKYLPKMTETKPHEEHQYLDLVREILENGEHRPDR